MHKTKSANMRIPLIGILTLLWLVLIPASGISQNTCSTALSLPASGTVEFNDSTGEAWVSFIAPNDPFLVSVRLFTDAIITGGNKSDDIDTVEIYSGTCSSLTSVYVHARTTNSPVIFDFPFTSGTQYYARISNTCNCNKVYLLTLLPQGPSVCESNCNLSCNGNFDQTSVSLPIGIYPGNVQDAGCWNSFYNTDATQWEYTSFYDGLAPGGFQGNPDYFNTSAQIPSLGYQFHMGIPSNDYGYQTALTGNGYAGIFCYVNYNGYLNDLYNVNNCGRYFREYLQQSFCDSMVKGRHYQISFSSSLSDKSGIATYLGVAFSTDTFWQPEPTLSMQACYGISGLPYTAIAPYWETPTMNSNDTGWTSYTFQITPNVNYKNMSIGNFRLPQSGNQSIVSNDLFIKEKVGGLIDTQKVSYYYIDGISVIPVDTLRITGDDTICRGGQTYLWASINGQFPNGNYIDTAGTQTWTSSPYDPILASFQDKAYVPVSPSQTTTYTCSLVDRYGCTYTASFTVVVLATPDPAIVPVLGMNANINCTSVEYTVQGDIPGSIHIWFCSAAGISQDTSVNIIIPWNNQTGSVNVVVVSPQGCTADTSLLVGQCCEINNPLDFDSIGNGGVMSFENDSASRLLTSPVFAPYRSGNTFTYNTSFMLFNGVFIIDTNITFLNCDLMAMGTNCQVDVRPGYTLTIDSCKSANKCDIMWEGIHVEDSTAMVRITGHSILADAKNLVYSKSGGRFEIENSVIRNCVTGVIAKDCFGFNPSHIYGTTIGSTGVLKQAIPANPVWMTGSYAGMEIYDCWGLQVGDSAQGRNTFQKLSNGILIKRSTVDVWNNDFKRSQFIPAASLTTGYAINALGGRVVVGNPQHRLSVGSVTGSSNTMNLVDSCTNGIYVFLNYQLDVLGNTFNMIDESAVEGVRTANNVTIYGNTFTGNGIPYDYGVKITDPGNGHVSVTQNILTQANLFVPATTDRYGVGILLETSNNSVSSSWIAHNEITRNRIGVWTRNVKPVSGDSIVIRQNTIDFDANWGNLGAPSVPHSGISLQNCQRIVADSNTVTTLGTSVPTGSDTLIRGILVENTPRSIIAENYLYMMQSGIIGRDFVRQTIYPCNTLDRNTNGFLFTGASGSANVGVDQILDVNNGNAPTPTGNRFMGNALDLSGAISPSIDWYYDASNLIGNINITGLTSGNPVLLGNDPICGQYYLPPLDGDDKEQERAKTAGEVIEQSAIIADANKAEDGELDALRQIQEHPEWLDLGVTDDTLYQSFVTEKSSTDLGAVVAVTELLKSDSSQAAALINAGIIGETQRTNNQKTVNDIYLRSWDIGQDWFEPLDSAFLYAIALQSPYEGGEAVYRARVMLGIDQEEYGTASVAKFGNIANETGSNAAFYPNPAADQVTIQYELDETQTGTYEITGVNGQLVQSGNLKAGQPRINTSSLQPGVYQLKLTVDGKLVASDKLVIIRQ